MFDPYYETKVNPQWGRVPVGTYFGGLLVFLGCASIVFTIVDLTEGVGPELGSVWQENSIWPTIGKGIWVGGLMIATGLIGMISRRERTQVSLYVFNALCWITAVFSLYQVLSCILHIEPYNTGSLLNSVNLRSKRQNLEVAMNSLLICTGALSFIVSLMCGLSSCFAGHCCLNRRNLRSVYVGTDPKYQSIPSVPSAPYNPNTVAYNPGLPVNFTPTSPPTPFLSAIPSTNQPVPMLQPLRPQLIAGPQFGGYRAPRQIL